MNESSVLLATTTTTSITKGSKHTAPFNFGPVSSRDNVLYTCLRPGYSKHLQPLKLSYDEQLQQMDDWIHFMKDQQGITNVIALLDDDECCLSKPDHDNNINESSLHQPRPHIYLRDLYTKWELSYIIQPIHERNSYETIMNYIDTVYNHHHHHQQQQQQEHNHNNNMKKKVIVHCASGAGRAGLVAAGWLVYKYGCTPAEATSEVLYQAKQCHVNRKGNVQKLEAWINGTMDTYMSSLTSTQTTSN